MLRTAVLMGIGLAIACFAEDNGLKAIESEMNDTYIRAVTNARRTRTAEEIDNIKDSEVSGARTGTPNARPRAAAMPALSE